MANVRNVHERRIEAPAPVVGALLDRLGGDDDPLWPTPAWAPLVLDRPLALGADGGHGPVRYFVSGYDPGRRIRFTFHPNLGLDGYHELTVTADGPAACRMRHEVVIGPRGQARLLWPAVIRWLHDALLEDLLDNAERVATGRVAQPARWSWWVRRWRGLEFPRPRAVAIPAEATLLTDFGPADFADAWQVPWLPGMSTDPADWARRVFGDPPRWVATLLVARNALVRLVGVPPASRRVFDVHAASEREALLGVDDEHLDFRVSVLVDPAGRRVTLSTVTRAHNRRGRFYLAVVRRLHPLVVRAMLRRALHRFALHSAGPHGSRGERAAAPRPS
ncbi:DUF2867 domain-containing protein [Natronosporangium hydrolyticum]|uniref:DUF2867 domain-containing protein n=1 Tax=Natronosporangium hydrolyticum TaxID=2811111 RepID=A0A895Y9X1_9ACTN|nr:DUF2867 domain-containing protein [Natronosporangium hydrolyticum]QSB13105.1 DUF2867 domain-containing protein [Natronosporangium hydrolyticum]